MSDLLTELVKLLKPRAVFANPIGGKGDWAVRFSTYGLPSFCIMLAGSCKLAVDGQEPITFGAGDFVLLPTTPAFTISSFCLAIAQVAERVGYASTSTFSTAFSRHVGRPPREFLRSARD